MLKKLHITEENNKWYLDFEIPKNWNKENSLEIDKGTALEILKIKNKTNKKYICVDKQGWPVEGIIGQPITNLLRKLIHTRKIRKIVDVERDMNIKIK